MQLRLARGYCLASNTERDDGNKGTVSKILPNDKMPKTKDGRFAEAVLNPFGVVGRCNPAQLFEQELNFIAQEIIHREKDDLELFDQLINFLSILNTDQDSFLIQKIDTEEKIREFISDVRANGLLIHQPPFFNNASPEIMQELYETFGIEKLEFEGISEKLIMGKMFFIKLRHEASGKFSARSAGQTSLLNVPFKTNEAFKKGTAQHNSNPIRFGEQELFNMLLLAADKDGARGVINFLRSYSSHGSERRNLLQKLIKTDPEKIDSVDEEERNTVTNAAQVIRAFFAGMGIEIESDQLAQIEDLIV